LRGIRASSASNKGNQGFKCMVLRDDIVKDLGIIFRTRGS
jgi:hypothetical protein